MRAVSSDMSCFFFFNDTATTEIYTLSLHDALPIYRLAGDLAYRDGGGRVGHEAFVADADVQGDDVSLLQAVGVRKSTRLNSSHANISYAVFCLKKKKNMEYI